MRFTPNQIEAVNHKDGNLRIIACAGSGKTTVMAERIAKMVSEGVDRDTIVAFTFTEKAAASLKFKIRECLTRACPNEPHLGGMYIGTIHAYAFQTLREVIPKYRSYDVLDQVKRTVWAQKKSQSLGLNQIDTRYWGFEAVKRFLNSADIVRDNQIEYDRIERIPAFRTAYDAYLSTLDEEKYIDFSGIIYTLVNILVSDPEILASVKKKVNYLIVDEYQDVNHIQEKLISLLAGTDGNLCVVGDDDQSIFEFQGSEVSNIIGFRERYDDVTPITFAENFRCPKEVIVASQSLISRNRNRIPKAMIPGEIDGRVNTSEPGDLYKLEFNSIEEEVNFVINKIKELRGHNFKDDDEFRGLDWGDMAIIVRNRLSAKRFIEPLKRHKIPFTLKGEGGLFIKPEIHFTRLILCFFADKRIDLTDEGPRKVPELTDIKEVFDTLEVSHKSWDDISRDLVQMKNKIQSIGNSNPDPSLTRIFLQDFFYELLDILGMNETNYSQDVLYDFGRLSKLVSDFESIHGWINYYFFREFVDFINYYAYDKTDQGGIDDPRNRNTVSILTVHTAKGLQFPAVFISDISNGRFPSVNRNKRPYTFLENSGFDLIKYTSGDEGERRLFYVACTRTRKFLFLTRANISDTGNTARRSDYITEFDHEAMILEPIADPTRREKLSPQCKADLELMPTSFSDLKHYIDCPYRYLLQQMMGFSPPINLAYGYGLQVHNLLNLIHKQWHTQPPSVEEIESLVESGFFLRFTRGRPFDNMKDKATEILRTYTTEYGHEFPLRLETEKPFELILGGALISGTIDLLQKLDPVSNEVKEVSILDYKTEKENLEGKKSIRLQLRLYALATKHSLGLNPKAAKIHYLTNNHRDGVEIDPPKLEETQKIITQAIQGIRGGKFSACPSERCKDCDIRGVCSHRKK